MAAVHQQRLRNWKLIGVVVTSLSTFVAAGVAGVKLIWPDSSPTNVCAQDGSVAAGRDISGTVITTRREPQQNLDQMDDRRTMECGNTVKNQEMNGRVFLLVKRSTASIIVLMIAIVYLFNNYHPSTNIVATSGSIAAGRDVILDWDPRELRRIVDDCNDSIRGLTAERERALTKAEELATNLALRRMLCSLFSES